MTLVACVIAVSGAVALACKYETNARLHKRQRPRPVTAAVVLAGVTVTLIIGLVDSNPLGGLGQTAALGLLPLAITSAGAIRFPDGVPARDVGCVVAFFAFVAAAGIHQCTFVWKRRVHEPVPEWVVRMMLACVATAGVVAHAFAVALRPARLWLYSRCAFSFQGVIRLAAVGLLCSLGADKYPPGDLDLTSSVLVNATYIAHTLIFALPQRRTLSASFRHLAALSSLMRRWCECGQGPRRGRRRPSKAIESPRRGRVDERGGGSDGEKDDDESGGGGGDGDGGATLIVEPSTSSAKGPGCSPSATGTSPPASPGRNPTGSPGLCAVCMAYAADHAFIPCGHICTCAACARTILQRSPTCPVCRHCVSGLLKTYRV